MQKILVIMYYIWLWIMIVTGIWLLVDVIKILICLLIDKIKIWKIRHKARAEEREKRKLNRKYKNGWKNLEEQSDKVDLVVEL